MAIDAPRASEADLKARAVELLAHGVVPFEQWANVFANPNFASWPGLKAKAFSVWFPTMVDFLEGRGELTAIEAELSVRRIDIEPVPDLCRQLGDAFKRVLTLFSSEEQAFLRDRRLQNVHGRLQLSTYEVHDFVIFNSGTQELDRLRLTPAEYRAIMVKFYPDIQRISTSLIERLIGSEAFESLTTVYVGKLRFRDHFVPLIETLGISAAAGSGSDE
jgi:hypothetical protein